MSKRISQLDLASPVTGAEMFAIVQNSRTKRLFLDDLRNFNDTSCQCTLVSRYNENGWGNAANTDDNFLQTYSDTSILATDGSWLEIFASGYYSANNNTKVAAVEISQGAFSAQFQVPAVSPHNDERWEISIKMQRTSQTNYLAIARYEIVPISAGLESPQMIVKKYTASNQIDWNNSITLSVIGQTDVAAANDVVLESWIMRVNEQDANS